MFYYLDEVDTLDDVDIDDDVDTELEVDKLTGRKGSSSLQCEENKCAQQTHFLDEVKT